MRICQLNDARARLLVALYDQASNQNKAYISRVYDEIASFHLDDL
jgi:hypothetical protein